MIDYIKPLDSAAVFELVEPLGPIYHGEPLLGYRRFVITFVHMPVHSVDMWVCSCGATCLKSTDLPCLHMLWVARMHNYVIRGLHA